MADHFYGKLRDDASNRNNYKIVVGASTAGASYIEVRIPDGVTGLRRNDVYEILEHIADFIVAEPTIAVLL